MARQKSIELIEQPQLTHLFLQLFYNFKIFFDLLRRGCADAVAIVFGNYLIDDGSYFIVKVSNECRCYGFRHNGLAFLVQLQKQMTVLLKR